MFSGSLIESAFVEFREKHHNSKNPDYVEYLGINFSDDLSALPVFKAYYTTEKSMERIPSLLTPLVRRDMLRALNRIDDTVSTGCLRCEAGLQKRTDRNMEFLYQWIFAIFPEAWEYRDEIRQLCRIRCTSMDNYRYAALYFVGIIADISGCDASAIRAVKLHYLLRECADPDRIGKNYTVNSENYLKLLSSLRIPELRDVSLFVREMLEKIPGELWIAAADYYKYGFSKYKIYLKKFPDTIYKYLTEKFYDTGCTALAEQIRAYVQWADLHPELDRYGIAICRDSRGVWSVNFYH